MNLLAITKQHKLDLEKYTTDLLKHFYTKTQKNAKTPSL